VVGRNQHAVSEAEEVVERADHLLRRGLGNERRATRAPATTVLNPRRPYMTVRSPT
jgi:hypothetical protein